jgi:tetratricopeptide (TPR) repeat protein
MMKTTNASSRASALILCLFATILLLSAPSFAETKKFVKEYTYKIETMDNQATGRTLALYQVSKLLLREIAESIQGTLKDSDSSAGKSPEERLDEIQLLLPSAVMVNVVNDKWDGGAFFIKAEVEADPADIAKDVEKFRLNEERTRLLKDLKHRSDSALKEIAEMRKTGDVATYNNAIIKLSATEWFAKGLKYIDSGNFDKAAFAFDYAIKRDPENANAWEMQGWAYHELGNYKRGIDKFDEAINLDPTLAKAYEGRGRSYGDMGDPKRQIEDMKTAAKLGSKSAKTFLKSKNLE